MEYDFCYNEECDCGYCDVFTYATEWSKNKKWVTKTDFSIEDSNIDEIYLTIDLKEFLSDEQNHDIFTYNNIKKYLITCVCSEGEVALSFSKKDNIIDLFFDKKDFEEILERIKIQTILLEDFINIKMKK